MDPEFLNKRKRKSTNDAKWNTKYRKSSVASFGKSFRLDCIIYALITWKYSENGNRIGVIHSDEHASTSTYIDIHAHFCFHLAPSESRRTAVHQVTPFRVMFLRSRESRVEFFYIAFCFTLTWKHIQVQGSVFNVKSPELSNMLVMNVLLKFLDTGVTLLFNQKCLL